MNNEINSIIRNLENTLTGEPWFGRGVYELLDEVSESVASVKPNATSHSMIELVYHMQTWADFTFKRLEMDKVNDMAAFEKLDWREIDPQVHGWEEGLAAFKETHRKIIELLQSKDDAFLDEKVDYRKYNFRFLINGLIQHNIYHAGQIAYVKKLLV